MDEKEVGEVIHFYKKIGVAVVRLTGPGLKLGDSIHIQGNTTDLVQDVSSMQIDHKEVENVKKSDEFGLKVREAVRDGDKVYKVT